MMRSTRMRGALGLAMAGLAASGASGPAWAEAKEGAGNRSSALVRFMRSFEDFVLKDKAELREIRELELDGEGPKDCGGGGGCKNTILTLHFANGKVLSLKQRSFYLPKTRADDEFLEATQDELKRVPKGKSIRITSGACLADAFRFLKGKNAPITWIGLQEPNLVLGTSTPAGSRSGGRHYSAALNYVTNPQVCLGDGVVEKRPTPYGRGTDADGGRDAHAFSADADAMPATGDGD